MSSRLASRLTTCTAAPWSWRRNFQSWTREVWRWMRTWTSSFNCQGMPLMMSTPTRRSRTRFSRVSTIRSSFSCPTLTTQIFSIWLTRPSSSRISWKIWRRMANARWVSRASILKATLGLIFCNPASCQIPILESYTDASPVPTVSELALLVSDVVSQLLDAGFRISSILSLAVGS
jgi:hypothetical protein